MKRLLMTPGPTPVAPETQLAMAQPIIHHRSPQFMDILERGAGRPEISVPDRTGSADLCRHRHRRHGRGGGQHPVRRRHGPGGGRRQIRRALDRAVQRLRGQGRGRLAVEWGHAVDPKEVAKTPRRQPGHQGGLGPGQRDLHRRAAPGAGTGRGDQEPARHHPGGGRHLGPGGLSPAHG